MCSVATPTETVRSPSSACLITCADHGWLFIYLFAFTSTTHRCLANLNTCVHVRAGFCGPWTHSSSRNSNSSRQKKKKQEVNPGETKARRSLSGLAHYCIRSGPIPIEWSVGRRDKTVVVIREGPRAATRGRERCRRAQLLRRRRSVLRGLQQRHRSGRGFSPPSRR